jgi:hypothetical protein
MQLGGAQEENNSWHANREYSSLIDEALVKPHQKQFMQDLTTTLIS